MQESDLPPWEREFFPIIFVGDELAAVPNFGIDEKYQANPKMTGLEVNLTQSKWFVVFRQQIDDQIATFATNYLIDLYSILFVK